MPPNYLDSKIFSPSENYLKFVNHCITDFFETLLYLITSLDSSDSMSFKPFSQIVDGLRLSRTGQ